MDKIVICSGCGWTGTTEELIDGACADCGYDNNNDVHTEPFLEALFELIGHFWKEL